MGVGLRGIYTPFKFCKRRVGIFACLLLVLIKLNEKAFLKDRTIPGMHVLAEFFLKH
jgi:hypothetical protein